MPFGLVIGNPKSLVPTFLGHFYLRGGTIITVMNRHFACKVYQKGSHV